MRSAPTVVAFDALRLTHSVDKHLQHLRLRRERECFVGAGEREAGGDERAEVDAFVGERGERAVEIAAARADDA